MRDDAADFDSVEVDADDTPAAPRSRWPSRRTVMAGVGTAVAAGGLAGVYGFGMLGGTGDGESQPVYFELPEMTVNLNTPGDRSQYLRIKAALEMKDDSVKSAIEPVLPRVLDAFQVYLRELRPSDIEGSAGLFRLKEELVRRVNMAIHPAEIDGVVFEEIIVQ